MYNINIVECYSTFKKYNITNYIKKINKNYMLNKLINITKQITIAVCIVAVSLSGFLAFGNPSSDTIQSQALATIELPNTPDSMIPKPVVTSPDTRVSDWIKRLRDYLGDLLVTNKEPVLKDGQSVIIIKEKKGKRTYIVLNPKQAQIIAENVVKFNESATQALGLKIKITVSISYPPLKVKITIEF